MWKFKIKIAQTPDTTLFDNLSVCSTLVLLQFKQQHGFHLFLPPTLSALPEGFTFDL